MKGSCKQCKKIIDEVEYTQGGGLCYSCAYSKDFGTPIDSFIHSLKPQFQKYYK